MGRKIEKKYLAGLKFHYSEANEVETGEGLTERQYTSMMRDLTPDDVMDWADRGSFIILVTADGQKYCVQKKAGDAA